tara:strand:- start:2846 stop:3199 length:354 start_codon:yes stop_codon:yes gene_type:complete
MSKTNNLKPYKVHKIISEKSGKKVCFYSNVITNTTDIVLDTEEVIEARFQDGNGRGVKPLLWFINSNVDFDMLPDTLYGYYGGKLFSEKMFEIEYGSPFATMLDNYNQSVNPSQPTI